jgi:hypothetical protein
MTRYIIAMHFSFQLLVLLQPSPLINGVNAENSLLMLKLLFFFHGDANANKSLQTTSDRILCNFLI